MPRKKNSYISWIGENLVESAKSFESSLNNLLQIETKKISYILESLDEASLGDNNEELCNVNDMLCETLKYVENIQDILSKKTLIGLYAINYDELKDNSPNLSISTDEYELKAESDISEENTESALIKDTSYPEDMETADDHMDLLQFENNLTPKDLLKIKGSSDFPYEIIDLDIQLSNNGEIIINNIEDNDEPTPSNESYDHKQDAVSTDNIIHQPAKQTVPSNTITDENISKKLSPNMKKALDIIEDHSSIKPITTPKVDIKFDDLIEIQIDTNTKYPNRTPETENITNDNITNKTIDTIAEYKACETPKDIELSDDEISLVESFGFFKDYYKV